MNPIVEFCISNLAKGGDYVYNQLENDPGIDVLEYGCLQNCGICSSGLYALVNGDIVEGESITKKIRTYRRNMDFLGGNCYDSD